MGIDKFLRGLDSFIEEKIYRKPKKEDAACEQKNVIELDQWISGYPSTGGAGSAGGVGPVAQGNTVYSDTNGYFSWHPQPQLVFESQLVFADWQSYIREEISCGNISRKEVVKFLKEFDTSDIRDLVEGPYE